MYIYLLLLSNLSNYQTYQCECIDELFISEISRNAFSLNLHS